jgi:hypothetical protein
MDAEVFMETLEDFTELDLQPFFDAQIFQPGFSTWLIDSTSTTLSDGEYETTLYLNQKLRACSSFHENEPLDVTLWDASWNTAVVNIRVGGEYDVATISHTDPFILVALNTDGKLNQGRLDNTISINEPTGLSSIPWVIGQLRTTNLQHFISMKLAALIFGPLMALGKMKLKEPTPLFLMLDFHMSATMKKV